MKYVIFVMSLGFLTNSLPAQVLMRSYNEDSLRAVLNKNPRDTTRIDVLLKLSGSYYFKQLDTCLLYATEALEISRKLNHYNGIFSSLIHSGEALRHLGDFTGALKNHFEALELCQKIEADTLTKFALPEAASKGFIGMNHVEFKDYPRALEYLNQAIAMRKKIAPPDGLDALFRIAMARAYNETGQTDSAFYHLKEARAIKPPQRVFVTHKGFGDAFYAANEPDSANFYYRLAIKTAYKNPDVIGNHISATFHKLASILYAQHQIDSSLYFAGRAFAIAREERLNPRVLEASILLAKLYRKKGNLDSTLFYQDIAIDTRETMYGMDQFNKLQLLALQQQRRIQESQRAEEQFQNTILLIFLMSITTVILVASILLFRSNQIKQQTNFALQKTLSELKATQSQLIQSEKMASLGELTAGIAHEIQNPLNFVNNFSEVNDELIDDLKKEVVAGNNDSVLEIANTIKSNQQKINHHGKRADGIVKSMLQHSRLSSGQKELTDINELCDEYVRLTYHGYRAKEKSFNVKLNSNFDPSLPKVNVVRQDIGRVLLNLMNNAFYAVNEKAKLNATEYEPVVTVSTKLSNGKIQISVSDNGNGVSDSIKEKIFQPFFTTKPTGQGTGLGLSLSYDIIKAHGGELIVDSSEEKGTTFTVKLPATI